MSAAGPYELQRLANIERNHAELARLGLLGSPTLGITTSRKRAGGSGGSGTQRRPKKRRPAGSAKGSRRSLRLGATPSSGAPAPAPPPAAPLEHGDAEWVQELFSANALPGSPTSASPRWERRRAHQHLTLSRCGRMIATTGCAGYGGALAQAPAPKSAGAELRWDVKVLALGTGGFAVGVGLGTTPSPFKSFGNSPSIWVAKEDGRTLHNRQVLREDEAGSSFGEGDTVTVLLGAAQRKRHRLSFMRNGREIGAACLLPQVKGKGKAAAYTLAVQPYMGGAALLL